MAVYPLVVVADGLQLQVGVVNAEVCVEPQRLALVGGGNVALGDVHPAVTFRTFAVVVLRVHSIAMSRNRVVQPISQQADIIIDRYKSSTTTSPRMPRE